MTDIMVEVVYALPDKQYQQQIWIQEGSTVMQAIQVSGIPELCPEIDLAQNKVGIYSRLVRLTDKVQSGDRIEIYRPLIADPKALRRQRAERFTKK